MTEERERTPQLKAETVMALARIFEHHPLLDRLTVKTSQGDIIVSSETQSRFVTTINSILAGIFENDPAVSAISFPAIDGTSSQISSRTAPQWCPRQEHSEALE